MSVYTLVQPERGISRFNGKSAESRNGTNWHSLDDTHQYLFRVKKKDNYKVKQIKKKNMWPNYASDSLYIQTSVAKT